MRKKPYFLVFGVMLTVLSACSSNQSNNSSTGDSGDSTSLGAGTDTTGSRVDTGLITEDNVH